jgi:ribosomal protein S18 acetylase RimI-like enzyme
MMDDDTLGLLIVAPGAQGQGVGSELMSLAKRGRPQLHVSLLEENLRARYFCQKHGFVEMERQLCRDTGQEQLLMSYRI